MSKLIDDVRHVPLGEIVKFDDRDDGTVDVYGAATTTSLDIDDQICDPIWLKRAMPEWFKWGNIREMHQPSAAGTATELSADDEDRHFIKANIVDPLAVTKVKSGVYKAFSVGIKRPRVVTDKAASGGRIVDGTIVEVSLVDRPANPECELTIAKMAGEQLEQVAEVVDKGALPPLEPGGPERYPINNVGDLKNAIQAVGRVKPGDRQKVIAHIKSEAARLGRSDLIPDTWKTADADVAQLQQIRDGLVQVMQAELAEFLEGEDERSDVSQLLCSLSMFLDWWDDEADEGEVSAPFTADEADQMGAILMAADADTKVKIEAGEYTPADLAKVLGVDLDALKNADPDPEQPEGDPEPGTDTPPTEPDATKSAALTKEDVADLIKEAVAPLGAKLEKVLATPIPGGPQRLATKQPDVDARKAALAADAAENRRLADEATGELRKGYLELASRADADLAKLAS